MSLDVKSSLKLSILDYLVGYWYFNEGVFQIDCIYFTSPMCQQIIYIDHVTSFFMHIIGSISKRSLSYFTSYTSFTPSLWSMLLFLSPNYLQMTLNFQHAKHCKLKRSSPSLWKQQEVVCNINHTSEINVKRRNINSWLWFKEKKQKHDDNHLFVINLVFLCKTNLLHLTTTINIVSLIVYDP